MSEELLEIEKTIQHTSNLIQDLIRLEQKLQRHHQQNQLAPHSSTSKPTPKSDRLLDLADIRAKLAELETQIAEINLYIDRAAHWKQVPSNNENKSSGVTPNQLELGEQTGKFLRAAVANSSSASVCIPKDCASRSCQSRLRERRRYLARNQAI
jgi:TFIIF-interacting CTD phosphatase-like protein